MSRIDLPRYHWLVSKHEGRFVTNTYSSSIGTLPDQGCVSVRTFNYRVYVDTSGKEESTFRLIVETYVMQPWSRGGHKTDFEQAEFESSEYGVKEAEEWLARITAKHGF